MCKGCDGHSHLEEQEQHPGDVEEELEEVVKEREVVRELVHPLLKEHDSEEMEAGGEQVSWF